MNDRNETPQPEAFTAAEKAAVRYRNAALASSESDDEEEALPPRAESDNSYNEIAAAFGVSMKVNK